MNKQQLEQLLEDALHPEFMEVKDRTEAHSEHEQSDGGGHYELRIVCAQFAGMAPLARHRLVNAATESVRDQMHALAVKAYTPEEFAALNQPKAPRRTISLNTQ
ncbi:BolA family transcriptional regulator [Acidithiobacillus marinus]|uniref:BolA family transcriptional regulator n=1 Tax=Acidithiobacillus marinus TaxID=187490 RepID=A0A2I1DK00_9PROT|nr:BolA family protein [Acidithiobacillus marinus]PKY10213.1 BolA family transcriptional regulator [Acidithiobacillus marinus]